MEGGYPVLTQYNRIPVCRYMDGMCLLRSLIQASSMRMLILEMQMERRGSVHCGISRLRLVKGEFRQKGMRSGLNIRPGRLTKRLGRRRWRTGGGLFRAWILPGMEQRSQELPREMEETVTGSMQVLRPKAIFWW
ncbi:hypothetical protein IMSAGC012_00363 [Lachnospiraceae bacterium]|nr:hypothetical protein IMSAGC012_00363 [Lachnospiraceae bacterium]